jgi:hypothetical protein
LNLMIIVWWKNTCTFALLLLFLPFYCHPPSRMLVHILWCADSVHNEENFNQHFNCALKLEHILLLATLEGKDVMQCSSYFLAFGQLVFFFQWSLFEYFVFTNILHFTITT